jgi:hypothetical protein
MVRINGNNRSYYHTRYHLMKYLIILLLIVLIFIAPYLAIIVYSVGALATIYVMFRVYQTVALTFDTKKGE